MLAVHEEIAFKSLFVRVVCEGSFVSQVASTG